MPREVALVTDSTASLPDELVVARDIAVVRLQVVVGGEAHDEGDTAQATSGGVADALRADRPVGTSRPTPAVFAAAYGLAAAQGARHVVSLHLSGELSGTVESAGLAARDSPVPVTVVDTRQLGMAVGFAVLAAADVLDAGGSAPDAAHAARARAAATASLFYVDTLEHLRRGGRIGAAAALLGTALSVKPLLHVADGRVEPLEKVRTASRALARLEELAVAAAGERTLDLAVEHLAAAAAAERLAGAVGARLARQLDGRPPVVREVGAVLGAHAGPGMLGVIVAPRL